MAVRCWRRSRRPSEAGVRRRAGCPGSSMPSALGSRDGQASHKACVVIAKERGLDFTYQLLIDGQPSQLGRRAKPGPKLRM